METINNNNNISNQNNSKYQSQPNELFDLTPQPKEPENQLLNNQNFTDEPYGIAVNKGQNKFLTELNEALQTIKANGTYDEIYATFYRQTLFANYVLEAHKLVENNQPINYQVLCGIMEKLYKQYYGLDITEEKVKIVQKIVLLRLVIFMDLIILFIKY